MTEVLFYPFHLCHTRTLHQLLQTFSRVHFRDYMAIQLSPFFGTTAYSDRMGDEYPGLLAQGRLVQGYPVSGPLSQETTDAVNRDLSDQTWRDLFHRALADDHRFQAGLFGTTGGASPAERLTDDAFRISPMTVADVKGLCRAHLTEEERDAFDYGFALLKTSVALVYTVRLAEEHRVAVATDSPAHHALLARLAARDGVILHQSMVTRAGY